MLYSKYNYAVLLMKRLKVYSKTYYKSFLKIGNYFGKILNIYKVIIKISNLYLKFDFLVLFYS